MTCEVTTPLLTAELKTLVRLHFEPKEDITAYESAWILLLFLDACPRKQDVERLGAAQRHVRVDALYQDAD